MKDQSLPSWTSRRRAGRSHHRALLALRVSLAALLLTALSACASAPKLVTADQEVEPSAPPPSQRATRELGPGGDETDPLPNADLTPDILFQLLAAEVAVQRGQVGAAAVAYLRLAEQTRDPRLARRAAELAIAEGAYDRAITAAKLWAETAPQSASARSTLETLYLSTGQFDKAEPLLDERMRAERAAGNLAEVYAHLQRALMRAPDRMAALALIERVSAPDDKVVEAWLARAALANAADQSDKALASARRAYALAPDSEPVVVTLARLLQRSGNQDNEAIKLLQDFVSRRPTSAEARFQLARVYAQSGRLADAQTEMEKVQAAEPDNPTPLFSLAQILYESKQPAEAEKYLRRFVDLPANIQRDNALAYLFLAQIAEDDKRNDDAINWLAKITEGNQYVPALSKRASLMAKANRFEEARGLLREAPVGNPRDRVALTIAEVQLLREANRHPEAFEVLDQALDKQPGNTELLYDHGLAAERVGKLQVMEASLRKLIAARPDSAHAYNALGYSLADRNIRLPEALGLIEKALALAPDDAHIIDSYGWVLFRMGKLDTAIEQLTKAYSVRPEAEIAVHLGEVLWAAGRVEDAKRYWREARGREPENETLKSTLARLNVAL